jgi:hypothetical protein
MRRVEFRCLLAGLVLCPVLAQGGDASAPAASDEAALKSMREEIVKLIGEPRCVNLVHCRVLALGARPCGGPSEYLAYSSSTGKGETLEAKAYEYSFLEEEVNRKKSAVGACEVLPQPRAACIDGRCMLSSDRR